ncbi:MAG: rhomboid family intramembrane serine protease [Candidatus Lactobacillus pullistercoris]|uniref:Rhomboid family intramembrane serine protease n=1 Tax=Candidatus Lactobacillus pullistercoris TaxID=2838636 RepID=A0A9E2KSI5_9LACO|nr:rhomboid family intramembrane serine protease [Candidatus Lactobacillus pullistercoris]
MQRIKSNIPPAFVTIALVFICIIMFIVETVAGGSENLTTLLKFGAMNDVAVAAGHQWWRLFTAQFLHIGIWHLVSNIVMIYYMGMIIEPILGHSRFLFVYLLSGVGGNLLSFALGNDKTIAAGASTALFGLFGAVLSLAMMHRNNPFIVYAGKQAFVLAVINLFLDLFMPNIDIFGHLGGLISGALLTIIFGDKTGKKISNKVRFIVLAITVIYIIWTIRQGMVISFK